MERLAELTENLNKLANKGSSRERMLELCFDIIRQLNVAEEDPKAADSSAHKPTEPVGASPIPMGSLNDSFHPSSPDLSQRLQQIRQGSLKSSMGINDRYLFMETLFKGDAHAFDTMIGLLDEANSFLEAEKILSDYVRVQPMGDEQAMVIEKFQELLKRRFSAI